MDDFRPLVMDVLYREADRPFNAIQIIIDATTAQNKKRSRNSLELKLKRQIILELILDFADGLLCRQFVQKRTIAFWAQ
jgi:hypothetical protein